jgi:hypothetical protein
MADAPVACRLSVDERRANADSLLPSVLRTARSITALPNGILMELEATTDALRHISEVIDRERQCCPFLRFQLDVPPNGEAYVMSVTGPEGTADLLAELALIGLSTGVTEVRIDRTETVR